MFKRREPRTILQNLREVFWPSMGWIRACHYAKHRLVRLSDTTHSIAGGIAIGASVSFTPLVGTHFLQAMTVAWLLRKNVLAAAIGTFVGNPWTFPFMWWAAFSLGQNIFGFFGAENALVMPDHITWDALVDMAVNQTYQLFMPWIVGGYMAALIFFPLCYPFFYFMIRGAKAARIKVRTRKIHQAAKELTGQD